MDSNEFYQWVRDTLNRGSTVDTSIPKYVQAATLYIERQHPFSQLEWWANFTLEKEKDQVINLPSRLRDIEFLRIDTNEDSNSEEEWKYLYRRDPKHVINRKGQPEVFWTNERGCLVLDALPDKDYPAQLKVHRFTEFPPMDSPEGTNHWLLDYAPDVLHAQTMYMMSAFIREDDQRIRREFKAQADEGIMQMKIEDARFQESGQPAEMLYWPQHIPLSAAYHDASEG